MWLQYLKIPTNNYYTNNYCTLLMNEALEVPWSLEVRAVFLDISKAF